MQGIYAASELADKLWADGELSPFIQISEGRSLNFSHDHKGPFFRTLLIFHDHAVLGERLPKRPLHQDLGRELLDGCALTQHLVDGNFLAIRLKCIIRSENPCEKLDNQSMG